VEECEIVTVVSIWLAVRALLLLGCSVVLGTLQFCVWWVGGWVGKMALLLLLLLLFCEAAKEWVVIQSVCLTVCSDGDVLSGAV